LIKQIKMKVINVCLNCLKYIFLEFSQAQTIIVSKNLTLKKEKSILNQYR
jgi:hypothetical protein